MKTTMSRFFKLKNKLAIALLALLPLLVMLPTMGSINYPTGGRYSDLAITHLPNAEFIRYSILQYGQIPLWNPMIMSGYPFVGDPLSGLWYLPGWISLFFPLPFGINLLLYFHIVFGSICMYFLLKKLGARTIIALVCAAGFALLTKSYAHYGAGHITFLYAVYLTPALLLSETIKQRTKESFSVLTIFMALLIILADIRWFPFALFAWLCISLITERYPDNSGQSSYKKIIQFVGNWLPRLRSIFVENIFAILMASPFLLPFFEFLLRSTRIRISAGENLIHSLPAERLLGLIIPPVGGFSEWVIYPGIAIILLVTISFLTRNWRIIFLSVIFLYTLLWALGDQIPLVSFLASIPGLNLIRVPPRGIFLGELMALLSAGLTLEWLVESAKSGRAKQILPVVVIVGGFIGFLGVGVIVVNKGLSHEMLQMLLVVLFVVTALIIILFTNRKLFGVVFLGVVLIIDLFIVDISQFSSTPSGQLIKSEAFKIISKDRILYRAYSSSYAIPQEIAMESGIALAQGVNPMQVADYVEFMVDASGIPNKVYGVVVPPLQTQPLGNQAPNDGPDRNRLGLLNVKYIVEDHPIAALEGNKPISNTNGIYIYQNELVLPRIYFLKAGKVLPSGIKSVNSSPNEIKVEVSEGGTLIFSEICYPGWRAWVDGKENSISCYDGIFRMLKLESGGHRIIMRYQPDAMYAGLIVFVVTLNTIIVLKKQS